MKKIVKILLKTIGIVVLVIIFLLAAIRLAAPPLAVRIANKKLPGIIGTEASIGGIKLKLSRGYLSLRDIRVSQPDGYGEGLLLKIPEVYVRIKLASLLHPPLTIEEVALNDAVANVIKDKGGRLNLEALIPPTTSASPPAGAKKEKKEERASPAVILVEKVSISNFSFSYTDSSFSAETLVEADEASSAEIAKTTGIPGADSKKTREEIDPDEVLRVELVHLNLLVTDLRIDPSADPAAFPPAAAQLDARIVQKPRGDAILGLAARIGPVGGGIPPVNAVLRLGGLELEPLSVVIPAGTAQVLGGDALDLGVDMIISPEILDCDIEIEAAGGHNLSLSVGGTPDKPEVDTSGVLFSLMLHAGGGVGALAGNVGGAGVEVASAAAETTAAVGAGAANVVGSVAGGLFKAVTKTATGDLKGAVGGLSDATVGTAGQVADAAGDVAGEVAEGASSTADVAIGEDADRDWRAAVQRRWAKNWRKARELLGRMPFPPAPKAKEGN